MLEDNPELCAEVEAKIREVAELPAVDTAEIEATPLTPVAKPPKKK